MTLNMLVQSLLPLPNVCHDQLAHKNQNDCCVSPFSPLRGDARCHVCSSKGRHVLLA